MLGRVVSSPWPDRIEIRSIQKNQYGDYDVRGDIIEVTSTEAQNGGAAATTPVTLNVSLYSDRWLITGWNAGTEATAGSIVYTNTDFGFDFTLPKDWTGYTVVMESWKGKPADGAGQPVISGPKLLIRSPRWTKDTPAQDIPVMVFTIDQFTAVVQEKYAVSAAPISPSELGRNSKYVFALPARYNFAYLPGNEDVEKILTGMPLRPTESIGAA